MESLQEAQGVQDEKEAPQLEGEEGWLDGLDESIKEEPVLEVGEAAEPAEARRASEAKVEPVEPGANISTAGTTPGDTAGGTGTL